MEDGRFVGPFAVQLHTPAVGHHFLGMAKALRRLPGLSDLNREIATIVVGARFDAAYELVAHKHLGQKFGLSENEYLEILNGKKPETLTEEGKAVFDVAYELASGSGPMAQETWENAVRLIGKDATTAVVHYVGFYSYVSVILRGFDVKVPEAPSIE